MGPRILHFMWYMWQWVATLGCSRTLLMNCCRQRERHIVIVGEIRVRIGFGRRHVGREALLNAIKGRERIKIIRKCDTQDSRACFEQSVHKQSTTLITLWPNCHVSHHKQCVWAKSHGSNGSDGGQWERERERENFLGGVFVLPIGNLTRSTTHVV